MGKESKYSGLTAVLQGNRSGIFRVLFLLSALILIFVATPSIFAYSLSNSYFNIQTGSYGEISSLQLVGDAFPTNYVMNASNSPKQNTAGHQWLGELLFEYRVGTGAWTKASTNQSGDVRAQSQTGSTVTVAYQNSANTNGIRNFQLTETYSLVNDYFRWEIKLKNTGSQNIEFGDVGLPLPFNERWPGGEAIYETRVVSHSNVANNNSYIYVIRPSGIGSFLLMTPDASTGAGFEYKDHWRTQERSASEKEWCQDQADWAEGLNVFYIHSNRIKSTGRGYLPNTSLILAPGEEKVYAFKFFKVANLDAMKEKLYSEGLIDVNVVPGMIVPTNITSKFDLHTAKNVNFITAQYPAETTISYLNTVGTNHKIYQLTMSHLGQNNITVDYGNGEKTVLQFYVIEPIADAIQRHATFMVQKTQWNAPGQIYDKVFDDWMMDTKSKRGVFNGYWGWGDDWGYTHAQFLAEKNVLNPVTSEVVALDQYLETAIWSKLMNGHQTDYLIHDFLMPEPNDTPTYRGYAYPHIYNTYFSMYKIAKLHPNITSFIHPRNTYLLRCYNIFKALYGSGVAYNWNTGLMGELTTPEIIQALRDEGYSNEANTLSGYMTTKYNNFKNTTYPYGSEYSYDNTGEEAVYTLAKMNGNSTMMSKINAKTRACRGTQPLWYYYSVPITICGENWWQFQYTTALAGYCMDDWMMNYSTTSDVDARMAYAAKVGCIATINSGQIDSDPANIGTVSWTYQAEKGNLGGQGLGGGSLHNGWRQMAGEADLGLFGAIKLLSADVANDPIFGLYGYGCDVVLSGSNYVVTPKDGIFKRLNMVNLKMSMVLEQDEYTSATISSARNYVEFTLKNKKTTAHTTKVTLKGLAAGSYDVLVDNIKAGSFNVAAGQAFSVNINVGTASTYNVKIQQGSSTIPEVIAHYKFDETSGTTAADSSSNGNNATLNGGATWTAGKNGNAVNLDGSNGYVNLPAGVMSSLNDFTVAAWVKLDTRSNWARIFDFGTGTGVYMFLAPQSGSGTLRFAITNNGNGNEQQINASPALATGVWKHVAVTLSGNTGILYIDGVEVARNTNMTLKPSNLGNTNQNYIGKSQWADPYLDGQVDDFKIYSRALSASEISSLYGGGSTSETNVALQATASTSYCSPWESITALNDGFDPTSSNDRTHAVYGNWNNPGTTQWVEYDFSQNYTISKCEVYWFKDVDSGGGIDVPASFVIKYWDGNNWVTVSNPVGLGVAANQYNITTFTPVSTNKIRLEISAKATTSTGIEEWKVWGK